MASAAFVTEFRSFISFECEKSTVQFLNSKNYNNTDQRMAPQDIPNMLEEEKKIVESFKKLRNGESPPMARNDESPPMARNDESPPMARNDKSPPMARNDESPPMARNGESPPMARNGESPPMARNGESPMSSPGTSGESSSSPESQPSEGALDTSSMMVYQPPSEVINGMENGLDHLKRMEGVLEKNGIFGQNPSCSYEADSDEELEAHKTYDLTDNHTTIPKCHFCGFSAVSREEHNTHIHSHFPYKCTDCSYMARTKGRLENHMKNHREVPNYWPDLSMENGSGMAENGEISPAEDDDEPKGNKKNRITKCRHCDFVGQSKSELYAHLRLRLCFTGPLLECAFLKKNGKICDFCTHYKHHLEYHLRNHYESKPYKCRECKYTCVNQSMLNSHMKSHSNNYPYRCKTCTYATKYLHSLKMHLQKYDHQPDHVLNKDGTINTDIIIDVNGRRRGPKPKKAKTSNSAINQGASTSTASPPIPPPSHSSASYNSNPSVSPLNPSFPYNNMFNNPMISNIARNGFYSPPFYDPTMPFRYSPPMDMNTVLRCHFPRCEFVADSHQTLQQHISAHLINNYHDPIGINPIRFQFGQDMQGSSLFHFGSDNSVLGSQFQNGAERIPRMQAGSQPQFRSQEHTEVRAPGAFKMSAKVMAEMEMRGGTSPPISNGTLFHEFGHLNESRNQTRNYFHEKQNRIQGMDENLSRFGNGIRSSSLSPPSMEQAGASCSCSSSGSSNGICCDAEWDYASPIDLTKNFPSTSKFCNGMDTGSESKPNNTNPVSIQPQRPVKHRRKGKAFKIDQYMQYEDHSPEYTSPLLDMENQFQKQQSNVKMEVEDLSLASPRINGESQVPNRKSHSRKPKTSEKNPTSKRMKYSPQTSHQVSSQQCSTPKVPNTAAKIGHPAKDSDGVLFREVTPSGDESGFYSEDNKPGEKDCGTLDVSFNHPSSSSSNDTARSPSTSPKLMVKKEPKTNNQESKDKQTCFHCQIGFSDFVMLCMHMACHTVGNPFKCQKCNEDCKDRVRFMYHILNECKRS